MRERKGTTSLNAQNCLKILAFWSKAFHCLGTAIIHLGISRKYEKPFSKNINCFIWNQGGLLVEEA